MYNCMTLAGGLRRNEVSEAKEGGGWGSAATGR
jgi:hypothetical protein